MRKALVMFGALLALGCGDETEPTIESQPPPARQREVDPPVDPEAPVEEPEAPAEAPETPVDEPEPPIDEPEPPVEDPEAPVEEPEPPVEPDPPAPMPGQRPPLPDLPVYSHGECPVLGGGPDRDSAVVTDFPTGDQLRDFRLLVPSHYDGSEPMPVIFGWHWLGATSNSFVTHAELETAIDEENFIVVLPDALRDADGDKVFYLTWPFAEFWGIEPELQFFDDLLACVNAQFNVDRERVYGIGVSAGGLWLTHMATTERANHFAAIEVLSGGLGDMLGVWRMEYAAQPNKFPALVLWGGPNDWLALSFQDASVRLRDELVDDDHFVVECTHDAGHGMPPVDPPPGETKFHFLWRFLLEHPYSQAGSPYAEDGLPDVFPDWCRIAGQ